MRNGKLTSHHQLKNLGKVKRKCHVSYQPPRILGSWFIVLQFPGEGWDTGSSDESRKWMDSCWNPSWLNNACATRKDPEPQQLDRDNPENNLITFKPKTVRHAADPSSFVSLPSCSLPGHPSQQSRALSEKKKQKKTPKTLLKVSHYIQIKSRLLKYIQDDLAPVPSLYLHLIYSTPDSLVFRECTLLFIHLSSNLCMAACLLFIVQFWAHMKVPQSGLPWRTWPKQDPTPQHQHSSHVILLILLQSLC